jgi:FMN reductase
VRKLVPDSPPPSAPAPGTPVVVAVSGNPRPQSRTRAAAEAAARAIARHLAVDEPVFTIDTASFAAEIFAAEHPRADAAARTLAGARVAVVASPVHKASYTGLLKSFLDLYGPDGLDGVVAVPLVVPGNPAHALAGELHLRPLLVELGATVPTRALVVPESRLAEPGPVIDAWLSGAGPALARALTPEAVR